MSTGNVQPKGKWSQWLRGCEAGQTRFRAGDTFEVESSDLVGGLHVDWLDHPRAATSEDQTVAWQFYTQLRSRITTQPLHHLDGDEKTALDSVYKLFEFGRTTCEKGGPKARRAADIAWYLLNQCVRPVTAKWHARFIDDKLLKDDRLDFRADLEGLRKKLIYYCEVFAAMAEDRSLVEPIATLGRPVELGSAIPFGGFICSPEVEDAAGIERAEKEAIKQRRERVQTPIKDGADLVGLALSGGGLRSATFCLGALQGMARHKVLPLFDYLSTVSGGGYCGSFLTIFILGQSADSNGDPVHQRPFARVGNDESAEIAHIRASSKSLLGGGFWRRLEIPVLALLGWIGNLFVIVPPVICAAAVLAVTNRSAWTNAYAGGNPYANNSRPIAVLVVAITLFLIMLFVVAARQRKTAGAGNAGLPTAALNWAGFFFLALIAVTLWYALPFTVYWGRNVATRFSAIFANSAFLAGVSAVAIPIVKHLQKITSRKSRWKPIWTAIAFAVLPVVFICAVLVLATRMYFPNGNLSGVSVVVAPSVSVVVALLAHCFMNINGFSLHPFYRDRISRAFHIQVDAQKTVGNQVALKQVALKLGDLDSTSRGGPYHLINAALNAPASKARALRGRTADFFVFSKEYCGSEAIGYFPTAKWQERDPGLDLATAIAISGAAASPFLGVNNSQFNFWAALFNVRLDYWLPVPGRKPSWLDGNPGPVYWLRQFSGNVTDSTAYVDLSDGGHIENLGVYELLRRRCKFIVSVDGECDPGITCGSLLQVIRYAKIDFGVTIEIDLSRLKRAESRERDASGQASGELPQGDDASPLVDYHFAFGRITYPPIANETSPQYGWLLYLKSSLTGDEEKALRAYHERHVDFPHQTTSDLSYDEEQFEAYRTLGEHVVESVFHRTIVDREPTSAEDWFRMLGSKLWRKA